MLRANYRVPAGAGVGVRNLIRALKVYGAYVVDQGASMELDADSSHADQWNEAGLAKKSLPLTASDWRLVNVGSAPDAPARTCSRRTGCKPVTLKAASRSIRKGARFKLKGRIASTARNHGSHALVQVKRSRHWRTVHRTPIKHGRYATKVRMAHGITAACECV